MTTGTKRGLLAILTLGSLAAVLALKPLPQDLTYHAFADQRTLFGIPHFMDVASNLPFLVAGLAGVYNVLARKTIHYSASEARIPWLVLGLAIFFTGIGSAYYHWAPSNATLFWDRLPMAIGFSALLGIMVIERVDRALGRVLWIPHVLAGVGTLLYWRWRDDLRFYGLLQAWAVLLVPVILALFKAPTTGTGYLVQALGYYASSKLFELMDGPIFGLTRGIVSGHTIKHLAAAAGSWVLFLHLTRRAEVPTPQNSP
jgi:hypothetical protein